MYAVWESSSWICGAGGLLSRHWYQRTSVKKFSVLNFQIWGTCQVLHVQLQRSTKACMIIFLSAKGSGKYFGKSETTKFESAEAVCKKAGGKFARLDTAEDFALLSKMNSSDFQSLWIPIKKATRFITVQNRICASPFLTSQQWSNFAWKGDEKSPVQLSEDLQPSVGSCEEDCMIVARYGHYNPDVYLNLDDHLCESQLAAICGELPGDLTCVYPSNKTRFLPSQHGFRHETCS